MKWWRWYKPAPCSQPDWRSGLGGGDTPLQLFGNCTAAVCGDWWAASPLGVMGNSSRSPSLQLSSCCFLVCHFGGVRVVSRRVADMTETAAAISATFERARKRENTSS